MDATVMINLSIDGREVQAHPGAMIIQAADAVGIYIPRFCYHEKLSIAANCRMCLVEVEKAPKPLPACATPVAEGMVVKTRSALATEAQQGTMEFLLINHPLDCPVCDQGGECPLQDQAMGYGQDHSRYLESKRAMPALDLGPLIATSMTRCIHCTRCVRFGQEIAGAMELGATGRGESMVIETYLDGTVDSEVSGNMIDLCPVGALTSKPYRFTARPWELLSHNAVSPHDCLGSNLTIQTAQGNVKRVVPRTNESINECWLSDRDRFAYAGADCDDRFTQPLVRTSDGMKEVSWEQALKEAVGILKEAETAPGLGVGALIHPMSSAEEFFLLQKLIRGLGSCHIDHRLFQKDFSDDASMPDYPGIETPLPEFDQLSGVVLIGCDLRKELPLASLRVRRMALAGGQVGMLGCFAGDPNFPVAARELVSPPDLLGALCTLVLALEGGADALPAHLQSRIDPNGDSDRFLSLARILDGAKGNGLIILGQSAVNHPEAAGLRAAASVLAEITGSQVGWIHPNNSAAAWWSGAVPHRLPGGVKPAVEGANAQSMTELDLDTVVLFGLEPALDHADPASLNKLLARARSVISFNAFRSGVPDQARIALPIAPYTESSGTFLNCNGKMQFSRAAIKSQGNSRPGWKILRVLGNFLDLEGFDYVDISDVSMELPEPTQVRARTKPQAWSSPSVWRTSIVAGSLFRVGDVPIYRGDPVVRRATALGRTQDGWRARFCRLHPQEMVSRGLSDGGKARVFNEVGSVSIGVLSDSGIPPGSIYLAGAHPEASELTVSDRLSVEAIG